MSFANIFNLPIIIRIRSNLYPGLVGSDPLLGVDKEFQKVKILVDVTSNDG